ncbi:18527_t:CDS:2 [Acaulospora morrowiae]|uniref:18527_t:CDS:1 n=1 Tax=Acaulospora morrowiae TaxID=94023 RepID=A0A9N9CJE8_9GLOM|nr:18527_t:CDS:2 [Acaulospora morrowiae]
MNRRTLVLSGLLLILLTSLYISFLFQTVPGLLLSYSNEHRSSSSNTTSNEHGSNSSNTTSNEHGSNSSNTISNTAPKNYNKTLGFENIYVINLAHRRDRHFKMGGIEDVLELNFEFFPAVSTNDSEILDKYDFDIAPNHKSCYVSHYRVYESIVHWEMLYIGHCSWERGGKFIGDAGSFQLYESTYPVCTHAYAVSLSGAKKLLNELLNPSLPVDLEIVNKIKQGNIKSYSLEPSAIVQWKSKDNPSDVSPGAKQWTYPLKKSTLHYLGFHEIKDQD